MAANPWKMDGGERYSGQLLIKLQILKENSSKSRFPFPGKRLLYFGKVRASL